MAAEGRKKLALVSVYNKEGLTAFSGELEKLGFTIVSTGGTAATLEKEGVSVTKVSDVTKFPEILGGRVKTLHPHVRSCEEIFIDFFSLTSLSTRADSRRNFSEEDRGSYPGT